MKGRRWRLRVRIRERLKSSVNLTPRVTPTPRKLAPHSRSLKRCVLGASLPARLDLPSGEAKKKKWPQTRGCQHSTQKPKSEKGEEEEGRSSCVSPSSLFLDPAGNSGCGQSPRPDHPGSHSRLLSAAPAPQPAFPRGGRAELGLRPGRRKEAAAAGRRKLSLTHLGSLRALEVWRESGGITV